MKIRNCNLRQRSIVRCKKYFSYFVQRYVIDKAVKYLGLSVLFEFYFTLYSLLSALHCISINLISMHIRLTYIGINS